MTQYQPRDERPGRGAVIERKIKHADVGGLVDASDGAPIPPRALVTFKIEFNASTWSPRTGNLLTPGA
jgi:hypothetical protein